MRQLALSVLNDNLSVVRMPPDAEPPAWVLTGRFYSVTRTGDELSIVCQSVLVPPDVENESGWRAIKVQGPLAFEETGILADLSGILAGRGVSVFALSTFDTDYILVKESQRKLAVAALTECGHVFLPR